MVHDSSRLWMTLVIILLNNSIAFTIHINDIDQDFDNGHDSAQDLEVHHIILKMRKIKPALFRNPQFLQESCLATLLTSQSLDFL